jgi:hypothetical protein
VSGQLHAPSALTRCHCIEGCVGLSAGLDGMEKNLLPLPGIEAQVLICPVDSLVIIPIELSRLLVYIERNVKIRRVSQCKKHGVLGGHR